VILLVYILDTIFPGTSIVNFDPPTKTVLNKASAELTVFFNKLFD